MKLIVLMFLFVTLAASPASSASPQSAQMSKDEREVRQLERAWLDAYEKSDAKAMDEIVADDFMITFPDGSTQSKPQLMEQIRRPRGAASPTVKFHTEDVRSRAYDDTVVLTGRVVSEYQREGRTSKQEQSYTDTYVKVKGRWRVVASHLSNAPGPKK